MIMDIEELISICAKRGDKELVDKLRIIQSRGGLEIEIKDVNFLDNEDSEDSDYVLESSEESSNESEDESSHESEDEHVDENYTITLNKDGFYEIM
tara:strand:- start:89 stop:376 length:288 start_codon:yes stop_codon:yes gene_type:complete